MLNAAGLSNMSGIEVQASWQGFDCTSTAIFALLIFMYNHVFCSFRFHSYGTIDEHLYRKILCCLLMSYGSTYEKNAVEP